MFEVRPLNLHSLGDRPVEPAGRVVIEEDQRLGPAGDEVVDAHRHEVYADRVVTVQGLGDLKLGAYAVRGSHQILPSGAVSLRGEEPGEAADRGGPLLDVVDEGVRLVDVYPGLLNRSK